MRATNGFGPKWSFAVQFNSTAAVIAALPHAPPPDPTAPGPFSFAVADRVRGILANAGCHSLAVNALDAPIGGADVDQTLNLSLKRGHWVLCSVNIRSLQRLSQTQLEICYRRI
jgi:hypothetical protein